jgi:hypothetical protein
MPRTTGPLLRRGWTEGHGQVLVEPYDAVDRRKVPV